LKVKIIPLTPAHQAEVKVLQDQFKKAQAAHVSSYKALLAHLQTISGEQTEHKRTKLAVSDDGKHIVVV
jgi:hypothetical protein